MGRKKKVKVEEAPVQEVDVEEVKQLELPDGVADGTCAESEESAPDEVLFKDFCLTCQKVAPEDEVGEGDVHIICGQSNWGERPPGFEDAPLDERTAPAQLGTWVNPRRREVKETWTIQVPHPPEELQRIGQAMAEAIQESARIEAEKKAADKEFSDRIKEQEALAKVYAEEFTTGKHSLQVEVIVAFDYDDSELTVTRQDSGEIIEVRPLTDSELQLPLPMDGAGYVEPTPEVVDEAEAVSDQSQEAEAPEEQPATELQE